MKKGGRKRAKAERFQEKCQETGSFLAARKPHKDALPTTPQHYSSSPAIGRWDSDDMDSSSKTPGEREKKGGKKNNGNRDKRKRRIQYKIDVERRGQEGVSSFRYICIICIKTHVVLFSLTSLASDSILFFFFSSSHLIFPHLTFSRYLAVCLFFL